MYMNKDENPSTISTRHVETNVNTQEENQNNQNSSNEVSKTWILEYTYNWNEKENTY